MREDGASPGRTRSRHVLGVSRARSLTHARVTRRPSWTRHLGVQLMWPQEGPRDREVLGLVPRHSLAGTRPASWKGLQSWAALAGCQHLPAGGFCAHWLSRAKQSSPKASGRFHLTASKPFQTWMV